MRPPMPTSAHCCGALNRPDEAFVGVSLGAGRRGEARRRTTRRSAIIACSWPGPSPTAATAAKDLGRADEAIAYFHRPRAAWQKVVDDNPARVCHGRRRGKLTRPRSAGPSSGRDEWIRPWSSTRRPGRSSRGSSTRSARRLATGPGRPGERPDQHRRGSAIARTSGRGEGELRSGHRDPGAC